MPVPPPNVVHDAVAKRRRLRRVIESIGEIADLQLGETSQPTAQKAAHVEELFHDMTVELSELIQLKKRDGFFAEMLEKAPERQHAVDQIRKDYGQLLDDLEGLRVELDRAGHAPTARRLLHGWLTRFHDLDCREITLLQEVWNVDVGTAD